MPLQVFTYALLTRTPSRRYWQGMLVYCEALLVLDYAFLVPAALNCRDLDSREVSAKPEE